jgi:hypothetical protein
MPRKTKEKTFPTEKLTAKTPNIRGFPSESLVDNAIDMSPALTPEELAEVKHVLATATPEQFQQALSVILRKMLVAGFKDIPAPKSIKEMEVVFNMVRKAEGVEARERGHGMPASGFLPRVVGRKAIPNIVEVEVGTELDSGDTLFPDDPEQEEGADAGEDELDEQEDETDVGDPEQGLEKFEI